MLNKTIRIASLTFFIVIAVFTVSAYFLGRYLIKSRVSDFFQEKTNGLYHLAYDDIDIGLLDNEIKINGFNLKFDTIKANKLLKKDPSTVFFNIKANTLEAININYLKLFSKKRIKMGEFRLNSPQILTYGKLNNIKKDNFKYPLQPSNPIIKDLYKSIDIDNILLENVRYNLYEKLIKNGRASNTGRIDIFIDQFHSDYQLIRKKQYFTLNDLSIRFLNFESELGDNIHALKADTVDFSLKRPYLKIDRLVVFAKNIEKGKDYFNFQIPKLYLKLNKVNLKTFDSITAENLKVENAQITYYKNSVDLIKNKAEIRPLNKLDLYLLIKKYFKQISIHHLDLEAKLAYYRVEKTPQLIQKIKRLNLKLNNFSIDSLSQQNKNKIFYADNFKLTVHDLKSIFKDRGHELKIGDFELSSKDKNVLLKQISIVPVSVNNSPGELLYLKTDSISIRGLNFRKFYDQRSLEMNELLLSNIDIRDKLFKTRKKIVFSENSKLENILSPILTKVRAKKVSLKNADIRFNDFRISGKPGQFKALIDFTLDDLYIDIKNFRKNKRVFFSRFFDLSIKKCAFKSAKDLNIYRADNISLDNEKNSIRIKNFKITPEIRGRQALQRYKITSLIDLSTHAIVISDMDFAQAVFEKKFNASSLRIKQPKIEVNIYKKYLNKEKNKKIDLKKIEGIFYTALNLLSQIKVKNVEVDKGTISLKTTFNKRTKTIVDNKFNIRLYDFLFNREQLVQSRENKRLFFSKKALITINNQLFNIGDGVYKITANQIVYSSKDNALVIEDADVFPDFDSAKRQDLKTLYQVKVPQLIVACDDPLKVLYSDTVSLNEIRLKNAAIRVINQSSKNNSTNKNSLSPFHIPLPRRIKMLRLGKLIIDNTAVEIDKKQKDQVIPNANFTLVAKARNISVVNRDSAYGSSNFFVDSAVYLIKNFSLPHRDQFGLSIKQMRLDTKKENFQLTDLSFKGRDLTLKIPSLIVKNLDTDNLYQRVFRARQMKIYHPKIVFSSTNNSDNQILGSFNALSLYPLIKNIFYHAKLDAIDINKANIDIKGLKQDRVDIKLKDILVSKNDRKNTVLNTKKINLDVKNVQRTSKYYRYLIHRFSFSTSPSKLEMDSVQITPLLSKKEYLSTFKEQTERVQVFLSKVEVDKINLQHWFDKKQIWADKIAVSPSVFNIFTDKRLPKKNKPKLLPQTLLSSIKRSFYFNTLVLNPSKLSYSEYTGNTAKGLNVSFDNLQLKINRITNIRSKLKESSLMSAVASGLFMGKGKFDLRFGFDLSAENKLHTIKGHLIDFPLINLNDITEDAARVKLRKGYLKELDFDMRLTNRNAIGQLNLVYDSLGLSLMKRRNLKERKILSGIVNTLLRNQSSKKQEQKSNIIYLTHDNQKSFIGYWWRALFSGIKYSFGLSSQAQRNIKRLNRTKD